MSATPRPLFRFWFERRPPDQYIELLNGLAMIVGDNSSGSGQPEAIGQADAIVASARVRYDGELMDRVPGLRVISRTGVGLDNIAVNEATARGIAVCNVPDGPTVSTAEHTIALLLAVAKQLPAGAGALRDGQGDFFNEYQGVELNSLCLGLIGLGQIGQRVAVFAKALGMEVIARDPYIDPSIPGSLAVGLVADNETFLARADAVSLHVPLTPETYRMVNGRWLAHMKPGAMLINTARGGLIDEFALLDALKNGPLRGAGLDVFDPEPPEPDNALLHRSDVVATPHVAGATGASKDRLWRAAITQALQVLQGEQPKHLVNTVADRRFSTA